MSDILNAVIDQSFQDQRGRYYFLFDCAEYGDQLKVLKFSLDERVSSPFKLKLQLTTREKIDPRKLNDRFARLTIVDKHQPEKRHYCGIVSKAVQKDKGFEDGFTRFNVTIRPELHFARMIYDNRIYQQQTTQSIVEQVLKESGVTRYRWHLLEPHEQKEYVVQYKRSNLQFIERLLAQEGISYRFDHHEDGCELVMFDKSIEAEKCTGAEELEYNSTAGAEVRGQSIKRFAWAESVRTNVATYREQHFKNPEVLYTQQWGSDAGNGQQRVLEKYTFPGYYKSDEAGKRAARYEADSLQADASEGSGMGHAQFLAAGRKFKMSGHDEDRYNEDYFLVSVSQEGRQPNVEEEFASDEDSTFLKTKFTCVRDMTPWRPKRPETQYTDGDHLATVVGPESEEIHCDEFGRIKLFYHWDRKGKKDDSASCWVRVSQNWAGSQYGGMMIPRVGQSVIVSYINSDIEQPVVTGRIFNSVEQVPYKLPDNKTKTVIKSQTHKGNGFNSIEMEDEQGREEIFVHAERDYNTIIENEEVKYVKKHSITHIDGNTVSIVNGGHSFDIGKSAHMTISGSFSQSIGMGNNIISINNYQFNPTKISEFLKQSHYDIFSDQSPPTEGSYSLQVNKRIIIKVGGDYTLNAGSFVFFKAKKEIEFFSGKDINFDSQRSIDVRSGKDVLVEAVNSIKLQSGSASICIYSDGRIVLKGTSIKLN